MAYPSLGKLLNDLNVLPQDSVSGVRELPTMKISMDESRDPFMPYQAPEVSPEVLPAIAKDELKIPSSSMQPEQEPSALEKAQRTSALSLLLGGLGKAAMMPMEAIPGVRQTAADLEKQGETFSKLPIAFEKQNQEAQLEDIALKAKKQDLELNQQLADPNSKISELTRAQAMEQMKKAKMAPMDLTGLSAAQLKEMGFKGALSDALTEWQQWQMSASQRDYDLKKEREGRLREQFEFKVSDDIQKDRKDAQDTTTKDLRYKMAQSVKLAGKKVEQILKAAERGDITSASALGIQVAKAMGEVGVMTENDIKRYIADPTLAGGLYSKLLMMADGKVTPKVIDSVKNIFSGFKEAVNSDLDQVMHENAIKYMRAQSDFGRNISYEDARWVVDPNYNKPGEKAPENVKTAYKSDIPQGSTGESPVNRILNRAAPQPASVGTPAPTSNLKPIAPNMVRILAPVKGKPSVVLDIPKDKLEEALKRGAKEL